MDEIIKAEITDLVQDDRNGNKGTERGSKMLEQSIKDCGMGRSVLVDRNGRLIGGNKTQQAAIANGVKEVIVVRTDGTQLVAVQRTDLDLDEPKARKLAWIDNRISEVNYDPDLDRLLEDINNGIDLSFYYERTELDEMIDQMCAEQARSGSDGEGEENPEDIVPRCQLGEIYQLGRHRLLVGDCTDEEAIDRLVGNREINMIFADAPYGIDLLGGKAQKVGKSKVYQPIAGDENKDVARAAFKLLSKFKCTQFWWGANHYCDVLPGSSCWIVWDKQDGKQTTYADCELCWTNMDSPARIFKHIWDGFRRDSERGEERIHVNQKPVQLFTWCAEEYGSDSDIILDPFCGSGISIIGATELGGDRTVLACECNLIYAELMIRRWEKLTGEKAELS